MAAATMNRHGSAGTLLPAEKRHSQHKREMGERLDEWFLKFDADGNEQLDRQELTALLGHLHPTLPPPEASMVDELMAKAESEGGAGRVGVKKVVTKYAAYASNQKWVDDIFSQFDDDGSGYFERDELLPLLQVCLERTTGVLAATVAVP